MFICVVAYEHYGDADIIVTDRLGELVNCYRDIKSLSWFSWVLRTLYKKHDIESISWNSV